MIPSDGIFNPWRAYQRRGTIPNYTYCGEEQCDFEHLLWECKETHKGSDPKRDWLRQERNKHRNIKCLRNIGNVGKGYLQYPQSKEMKEQETDDHPSPCNHEYIGEAMAREPRAELSKDRDKPRNERR